MIRQLRTAAVAMVGLGLLGVPAGLLWAAIVPHAPYVILGHRPFLADPETQALIGADGWFVVLTGAAGLVCGLAAYLAGGRGNDVALLLALAVGGAVAAVLTWRIGHQIGLGAFDRLVHSRPDGAVVTGLTVLRAKGALVVWPLIGVVTYGVLEFVDVARRSRAPSRALGPGQGSGAGAGEPDQVAGGDLDFQAAPAGGDVDGPQR